MFKYFNNIFFRKTMIVILPIGLLVLIYHYLNISNNYLKEQLEIEKYIQNSLYTVEKSYNAIENILEKQMEKNMQEFLNEYDKVEDYDTLVLLKKMKCENIQGYYISKPLAKDKLEEFLLKFKGY